MTEYSSTITLDSQVNPGVQFTIFKMSEARRADFRLKSAEPMGRVRNLTREAEALSDRIKAMPDGEIDRTVLVQVEDLHESINTELICHVNPAWIRWGLKEVTGLIIDGEPATVESLISKGDPALFAEVLQAIKDVSSMTDEQLKNYVLPSISGAQTDGNATSTSAPNASSADTGAGGTVDAISPSA